MLRKNTTYGNDIDEKGIPGGWFILTVDFSKDDFIGKERLLIIRMVTGRSWFS